MPGRSHAPSNSGVELLVVRQITSAASTHGRSLSSSPASRMVSLLSRLSCSGYLASTASSSRLARPGVGRPAGGRERQRAGHSFHRGPDRDGAAGGALMHDEPRLRLTIVSVSIVGRTQSIASMCDAACMPAPKTVSRRASRLASCSVAAPLPAAVRRAVRYLR